MSENGSKYLTKERVITALGSVLILAGGTFIATHESRIAVVDARVSSIEKSRDERTSSIAIQKAEIDALRSQYLEVIQRLTRIETKVDRLQSSTH